MWIDRINRIIEIKEPKNRKKIHERFEARNEILLRMLEKNLTGFTVRQMLQQQIITLKHRNLSMKENIKELEQYGRHLDIRLNNAN